MKYLVLLGLIVGSITASAAEVTTITLTRTLEIKAGENHVILESTQEHNLYCAIGLHKRADKTFKIHAGRTARASSDRSLDSGFVVLFEIAEDPELSMLSCERIAYTNAQPIAFDELNRALEQHLVIRKH